MVSPRSLQNLVAGKNRRPNAVRVHARLNPETVELAKSIGEGQISKGLDKMAAMMASIYADVSLDNSLSQEDLIGWLNNWYANFPGEKIAIADPDYWLEKATLALSSLNFKRMMLLGAKVDIPESDRNRAIARWWESLA